MSASIHSHPGSHLVAPPRRAGLLRSRPGARVPVGRRLLFAERRRAALTVLGVAASLLLVLVLRGIFAGAIDRVTHYIRTSPADVFVSQSGVRTMHMSSSTLPPDTARSVAEVPGVSWVAGIEFATGSLAGPDGRQLTYLIGYDPATGHGGPGELVRGRAPTGPGEAVLDEQATAGLGLHLGDTATALGAPVHVVGVSSGGSSITNTTVFVTTQTYAAIRGTDQPSYLLAGARPDSDPAAVADRIARQLPGVTVQTRQQFGDSEARIVTDMSADLLKMMSTIGLLIALAVIALGLMTATLARVRDFAVLKALGARTPRLAAAITVQVLVVVALGTTTATAAALALGWVLPALVPAVQITITPTAVASTAAGALVVGLLAALWPLRRVATVDAATAFREQR